MKDSSRFLVLAFLLLVMMAASAVAGEVAESFKQELEALYSAWHDGTELTAEQQALLIEYGFISPPGVSGSDRVSDPDAFGYTFIDNEEPNGPEFDWIDITGTGSIIEGLADDNHVGPFDIGFSFPFYDQEHTQFYFQSNGTISFTDQYITLGNSAIPTTGHADFIAWFWDDLDPGDGGTVYYETTEVNGSTALVFSMIDYDDYPGGPNAAHITAQVIMYESGKIIIQYDTVEAGMGVESCSIGIQNSTGDIGLQYLYNNDPTGYPYDGLVIQFANSDAVVDGTVTNSTTGGAIEGAEVYLYPDGETEPAYFTTTDVNGEFHLEVLSATFDLEVVALGYLPYVQEDLVVVPDDQLDLTIELDEPENEYTFNGTITSADTPNLMVEGVTVEVTNADGATTATSDVNGEYSFGIMDEGIYDIYITFDPAGNNGYHDLVIENYLFDADGPHDFMLYEVLPPLNLGASLGDGYISLTWEAPVNHQDLATLAHTIELRRGYLNDLRELNNAKSAELIPQLEAELYMLENEYERQMVIEEQEIDELGDFAGYLVKVDGVIQDDTYGGTAADIWGLISGQFYDFQVAADYGYGDEYLVWSNEVTMEFFEFTYYYFDLDEYNWVDIDPANGVASTALSLSDDGYTDGVMFPDGELFTFYGIEYDSFTISANGVISFTPGYITFGNSTIPNIGTPNNMICPFWEDLYPPATANEDPWYYYDEETNRMIVTWHNPPLGNQTNILEFQVIMDLTDDYFIINYNSAVQDWSTGATIGVENSDGSRGVTWLDELGAPRIPENEMGVIWTSGQGIFGTIEGVIDNEEGTLLEDVVVELYNVDEEEPFRTVTTDEDGYYRFSQVWNGLYDIRVSQYPYEVQHFEDVEVISDETATLDVTLALETAEIVVNGFVTSADTPDTPIEGASVYCEQLDETVTTDATGAFTFDSQLLGVYSFEISFDPQGLTGYHNISYPLQEVNESFAGFDFHMFEILAPADFVAQVGDGFVACYWSLPVNMMATPDLEERIAELRESITHVQSLPYDEEFISERVEYLELELFPLVNELEYRQMMMELGELDDIEDFAGYKLRVNGTILPDIIPPNATSYFYTDVVPDEQYTFELAADYGYLADQLVWSDPSVVDYYEINYIATEISSFFWEELRPASGGIGIPSNLWTGGYTQIMEFPEGQTFTYYGTEYSGASFCVNGAISFIYQWIPWISNGIPNTDTPNNFMVAYWQEMNTGVSPDYDMYYYMDEENGRVIVQWYAPTTWDGTNILEYQAVLDLERDVIVYSYLNATEGWIEDITIGTENIDGTRGTIWPDMIENEMTLVFAPEGSDVFGAIEGLITDSETSDALEDVRVELYDSGEFASAFFSEDDGSYVIPNLWDGTYDLTIIRHGYHTQDIADVVVVEGEITVQDIQLVPLGANPEDYIDLEGVLISADTPDTPVEGASVYCVELDETVTTANDGTFSFGEQFIGQYNFYVSFDPQGTTGYHNIAYDLVDCGVGFAGLDFIMYEILAPESQTTSTGDGYISVTWEPPLNHVVLDELVDRIERTRGYIENLRTMNTDRAEFYLEQYELELYRLENELTRRENLPFAEVDDIQDFIGYRIFLNDEMLDVLLDPNVNSYFVMGDEWNLEDGTTYTVQVAADYGYGETPSDPDYMVKTDGIDINYTVINYMYWELEEFTWREIRPSEGGLGIPFNFTLDGYSELIEFPNGHTFTYWGEDYPSFSASANGVVSFVYQYITFIPTPIPNTNAPNNMACVSWQDFNAGIGEEFDGWYYIDDELNQVIVQWHTPMYGDNANIHDFEVIIDLEEDFFIFNYMTTTNGWNANAIRGLENAMGTRAITIEDDWADNTAYLLGTRFPATATVEGWLSHCSVEDFDPIQNAAIYIEGAGNEPIAFTDFDGHFIADSIRVGIRDIRIAAEGYWPILIDDYEFIEDENTSLDTLAMQDPNATPDPDALELNVFIIEDSSDSTGTAQFNLNSDGCGALAWRARARMVETMSADYEPPLELQAQNGILPGGRELPTQSGPVAWTDELDEPWSYLFGFPLDDSANMYSSIITSTAVYVNEATSDPVLYQYDHSGNYVAEHPVPTNMQSANGFGFYDMSTDPVNGMIIAGNADGDMFRFNPEMTSVEDMGNIGYELRAIAYDYINNRIFASDGGTTFQYLDLNTYEDVDLPLPATGGTITGLGYMPVDFDEAVIWILTQEDEGAFVHRFNPETFVYFGEPHQVYETAWGQPGGLDISNGYNPGMLNVNTILQSASGSDFIDIWEGLAAPVQWLWLENEDGEILTEGWLEPGESENITVVADIRYAEMEVQHGDFLNAEVAFTGSYWDDPPTVSVSINFLNDLGNGESELPMQYALHQNYPNPFNPMTEIKFDLVNAQNVKLAVYNVLGREVTTLVNHRLEAGFHSVSFDAQNLASGVYFYRIEAGDFKDLKKMVMIK